MKHILLLIFTLWTAAAGAQSIDSLDARIGFRDMYFGNLYDLQNMPEFILTKTPDKMMLIPGTTTVRYRQEDQLQFGAVKADRIYYMFKDSILLGYAVVFDGADPAGYIKGVLQQLYGTNTATLDEAATVQPALVWTGTHNECVLRVIKDGAKKKTVVTYTNTPAQAAVDKDLFPKQHDGF
jgi:hypothetical protein